MVLRLLDRAIGALAALLVAGSAAAVCLNVFYRYVVLDWLRNGAESLPWLGPVYVGRRVCCTGAATLTPATRPINIRIIFPASDPGRHP